MIEHCVNCNNHSTHTCHDPAKYADFAARIAGAVNEALGAKVDTLTNEVPKLWAMNDCYCPLIECYDDSLPCYQFIPRIGAFEVTY